MNAQAKKPAARARKPEKSVLAAWKGTYAEMTELVRGAFGFLEEHEQMKYSRDITAPECSFTYYNAKRDVTLSINSEYACLPWLVLYVGTNAYRMDRLVKACAPEFAACAPKASSRHPIAVEVRALLEYYAGLLRKHGRPILDGDEVFFTSLRKRVPKQD